MTSKDDLPLPLAGEGRGEGKPLWAAVAILLAFAACGNYSNDDLEFMNAVPARDDLTATIPRSMILPANEAELSKDTHGVINTFNGALDFLNAADLIRTYQPTSRIPNGRVWGPAPMKDHPDWQWRFTMTRDPTAPEMFNYTFDVEPVGAGDSWSSFISGSFVATGGVRRGMGHFNIQTDALYAAGFPFAPGNDGSLLKVLDVMYSTAAFPISVTMQLELYPKFTAGDHTSTVLINYHYEAQESGQGGMEFAGTDSASGASLSIVSRWLASGTGRADATVTSGTGAGATWTECWDDSFRSVYDNKPWATAPDPVTTGDPALCPDISTL